MLVLVIASLLLTAACAGRMSGPATHPAGGASTVTSGRSATVIPASGRYPLHTNVTATVFWIGEPKGDGSSEDNARSAFDDAWQKHFGGVDDYQHRDGFLPAGFTPNENPFYLDLPYSDFDDAGNRRPDVTRIYWYAPALAQPGRSLVKNRWVRLTRNGVMCYGQWEDAGPYEYDDAGYVFGSAPPRNARANRAGMDVSPALRDCLHFDGLNNDQNRLDWQFVDEGDVPRGPWTEIITTSQIDWR